MGHRADERCLDGTDILKSVRESWVHGHRFGRPSTEENLCITLVIHQESYGLMFYNFDWKLRACGVSPQNSFHTSLRLIKKRTHCSFAQTFCEKLNQTVETQQRSSHWKSKSSPWLKNSSGQGRSNVKTIFIVFFDCLGLVIMSSHPKNQDLHLTGLWRLWEAVRIYDRKFGEYEAGYSAKTTLRRILCCPSWGVSRKKKILWIDREETRGGRGGGV